MTNYLAKVQFSFIWKESGAEFEFEEGSSFEEKIHDELNDRLATWFANYGPEMLEDLSYPENWKLTGAAMTSFVLDEDLPPHINLYKSSSFINPIIDEINTYDQMFVTIGSPEEWFQLSQLDQARAIGLVENEEDDSYIVTGSFGPVVFDVYCTGAQSIEMVIEAANVSELLDVIKNSITEFFKVQNDKGWDGIFMDENVQIISCPSSIDAFSVMEIGSDLELLSL
jgi:hypothetical protein